MRELKFIIDTNVIIYLAYYESTKSTHAMASKMNKYDLDAIIKLNKMIKNNEIDVAITPQTLDEVRQGVQNYGKTTINYLLKYLNNVSILSNEQIDVQTKLFKEYHKGGNNAAFFANAGKANDSNDALIMAHGFITGRSIITLDGHFNKHRIEIKKCNSKVYTDICGKPNIDKIIDKNFNSVTSFYPSDAVGIIKNYNRYMNNSLSNSSHYEM